MNSYTSYSDNELVNLLKEEDKQAFSELYDRYWKKLLVQAMRKLNSEVEAEEIVQNIFLNLWRRRKTIHLKNSFHTYIASSVKYEIFARLATREKENIFITESYQEFHSEVNTTDEWIDYSNALATIEMTVKQLPEKCQLVFRLSREEGYSQKEIAEKLEISTKTVETHITKALKALRSSLKSVFISLLY